MESHGVRQMPPIEPLVATHLHPKTPLTLSAPSLPSKTDRFQSSLTDKCYKAAALSARALNASSILTAYQAELEENMTAKPDTTLWKEICVITDHVLRLHKVAIQATGRAMGLMVLQEKVRWLGLTNLTTKDGPGSHLLSMQKTAFSSRHRGCEEEEVAGLVASPLGKSEPSLPPSRAAPSPPSSVHEPSSIQEQVQRDLFHTDCRTWVGVHVPVPARGKKRQCSQCCHTSTFQMHSVIKMSQHAHPGRLPRALSNIKNMKKDVLKNKAILSAITQSVNANTAVKIQTVQASPCPMLAATERMDSVCCAPSHKRAPTHHFWSGQSALSLFTWRTGLPALSQNGCFR